MFFITWYAERITLAISDNLFYMENEIKIVQRNTKLIALLSKSHIQCFKIRRKAEKTRWLIKKNFNPRRSQYLEDSQKKKQKKTELKLDVCYMTVRRRLLKNYGLIVSKRRHSLTKHIGTDICWEIFYGLMSPKIFCMMEIVRNYTTAIFMFSSILYIFLN